MANRQEEKNNVISKKTKFLLFIVLILIIGGSAWVLWLFLHSSQTIELQMGKSFDFKGIVVKIDNVMQSSCTDFSGFVCKSWQKENGMQYQLKSDKTGSINYGYLGLKSGPRMENGDLIMELLSVNLDKKSVTLRLMRK